MRSTALNEWVRPPEPGKPREVAICGAKRGAVLERECGEDGIHYKRANGLAVADKAT